ncbi:MAG: hypothetical protein D6753_17125 [Planctomycetota bacterium]|nr:MAG: hypothetical protein D6753_17125 [Planctomycetota bacterium]
MHLVLLKAFNVVDYCLLLARGEQFSPQTLRFRVVWQKGGAMEKWVGSLFVIFGIIILLMSGLMLAAQLGSNVETYGASPDNQTSALVFLSGVGLALIVFGALFLTKMGLPLAIRGLGILFLLMGGLLAISMFVPIFNDSETRPFRRLKYAIGLIVLGGWMARSGKWTDDESEDHAQPAATGEPLVSEDEPK